MNRIAKSLTGLSPALSTQLELVAMSSNGLRAAGGIAKKKTEKKKVRRTGLLEPHPNRASRARCG